MAWRILCIGYALDFYGNHPIVRTEIFATRKTV